MGRGVDSRRRAARSEMGGEDKEQQNVTLRDMHRVMLVSAEGDKGLHSVEASDTTCSIVQQGQDPDNPDMKAANTAKEVDTPLHDTNPHQSSLSSPLPHPSPSLAQSAALRRAALTPADELRSFLRPHTSTLTPSAEVSDLGLGHEGNAPHTACKWGEVVEPRPIVMPSPSDVPHVGTAGVLDAQQQPAVNSRPSFREFPIVQSIREAFGESDSQLGRVYHNSAIGDPLPARDRLQVPVLASAHPEWLNRWMAANGPYLYHSTPAEQVPAIMRDGLRPHDEVGSQYSGHLTPRANSVYLQTHPDQDEDGHSLVGVDLRKLDPASLIADEDILLKSDGATAAKFGLPAWDSVRDHDQYKGWGHYADQIGLDAPEHVAHSLNTLGTVAVRGGVPPHVLVPYETASADVPQYDTPVEYRSSGWQFASNGEYHIEYGDEPSQTTRAWQPGTRGKALIEPDGKIHTWQINDSNEPHHHEVAASLGYDAYGDDEDAALKGVEFIPHITEHGEVDGKAGQEIAQRVADHIGGFVGGGWQFGAKTADTEWNDVPVLYANGKWIIGEPGEYHDDIHPLITRPGDAFYGEAGQQRARTESDGKSIYLEWYGGPKHPEVAADLAQRSGLPVQEDTLNSEGHWNFASIEDPGNPSDSNPQVPLHFPQGFDLNDSQRVPFIYTVNGQGQQPQVYFGHPGTEHAAITEPGGKTWSYSDQDYYDMPEMHPGLYNRVSPNKGPDGNWQWNESIGGYGSVKPRSWYTGDKSDTSKLTEFYTTHEPQHIKAVADAIHAHQPFGLPPTHDHQSYERSEPDPNEDWNFEGKTANYEEPLPEPLVNWKPGTLGKGLVTPEGRAYTWQIDRNHGIDGYPSHDQAYEAIHGHPMDDRAWDRGSYYTIHSDGHAAPLLENNSVHHAIMKAHLPEGDHCFHCGAEVHPDEDGMYTCSCGVHSQVEPEPDPDEWHFGSILELKGSKRHYTAQLMWNPPNTGKGFVAGDKLYTWNTSGNRPHHAEMWDHFRKSEPELPTMNAAFAIGSSGAVTKEYGNPDEYKPHLWQDPRLRVDPETEASEWRFTSLSDAPQGAVGDKKFTVTADVGGFVQNGGHVMDTKYRQGVTKPWELGKVGKGMLLDGKLHLWDGTMDAQTDPPHHDDVHESIYPEPAQDGPEWQDWIGKFFQAPKFYIGSGGKLDSYRTKNLQFDHEILDQIAAMHPDLTAPRPTDQGWDFS